jgi:hypothetical protein
VASVFLLRLSAAWADYCDRDIVVVRKVLTWKKALSYNINDNENQYQYQYQFNINININIIYVAAHFAVRQGIAATTYPCKRVLFLPIK